MVIANGSTREILLNSLQDVNKDDMPLLGMPFLSSAYILVNNDEKKFTLWQSRPTQSQKLVAIGGPTSTCVIASSSANPTGTPSPSPSPSSTNTQAPPRKTTKSLIVGVVVGITGAIAFVISAALLWRRQQLAIRKPKAPVMDESLASTHRGDPTEGLLGWKPELQSDKHPPQEMPTVPDPHLMDSRQIYELSTRSPHPSDPSLVKDTSGHTAHTAGRFTPHGDNYI